MQSEFPSFISCNRSSWAVGSELSVGNGWEMVGVGPRDGQTWGGLWVVPRERKSQQWWSQETWEPLSDGSLEIWQLSGHLELISIDCEFNQCQVN